MLVTSRKGFPSSDRPARRAPPTVALVVSDPRPPAGASIVVGNIRHSCSASDKVRSPWRSPINDSRAGSRPAQDHVRCGNCGRLASVGRVLAAPIAPAPQAVTKQHGLAAKERRAAVRRDSSAPECASEMAREIGAAPRQWRRRAGQPNEKAPPLPEPPRVQVQARG